MLIEFLRSKVCTACTWTLGFYAVYFLSFSDSGVLEGCEVAESVREDSSSKQQFNV